MSRTEKGRKPFGCDWWSRRPNSGISASSQKPETMRWWKRNTMKRERMAARKEVKA